MQGHRRQPRVNTDYVTEKKRSGPASLRFFMIILTRDDDCSTRRIDLACGCCRALSLQEASSLITFEQTLDACDLDIIKSLDVTCFSTEDVVNLILQRSEIIRDQPRPGKVTKAWAEGDSGPALALVDKMRDDLIRRAASVIWLEYQEIKPAIDRLSPKSTADIGCGYAIFDLFLWQDHPGRLLLIDLEHSEDRHFGFREEGAAYSNLGVARAFLEANGVAKKDIVCINPEKEAVSDQPPVDLAVSFISCGFHYPCDTYMTFFEDGVSPEGAVILDLRARRAEPGIKALGSIGKVSTLTDSAYGNARRVMMKKSA
ncbi:class I SAM-dependent methyltransferase [Marivita sp. S2033]|uniref:class I SAM-dependent methyltransferase n=1 Tax=Marivita sp. S2033 TaxID=3373187 RepID=UPI003981A221